ncbi:hypothetical protein B0H14DRAFT_3524616 [Mycena olivaceomarginata]|nr:hypothetical protein B0H14DRAFT_3524616 [Mycena olivaceomarginata]
MLFLPSPEHCILEARPVKPRTGTVCMFALDAAQGSLLHEGSGVTTSSCVYASSAWSSRVHVPFPVECLSPHSSDGLVRALLGAHMSLFAHAYAPPETMCLSPPLGLLLPVRARRGGTYDADSNFKLDLWEEEEEGDDGATGRQMQAVLEGPYGGPTHDAGAYGPVLFLAGGSGVTSTLGQLDDLVGQWVRGGRVKGDHTRQVEWVWCVRDVDALSCFQPQLAQIAAVAVREESGLVLCIRVFLTAASGDVNPMTSVLPGCEMCAGRPTVAALLDKLVDNGGYPIGTQDAEHGVSVGVPYFAAGLKGLMHEAGNAVAHANLLKRVGVDF